MDDKLERLKQEQLTPEQRLIKEIMSRPDGRTRLRRAGRHLPPARRSRQGGKGPGQRPKGQSRRPRAGVDLRRHADQPPEEGQGQPAASACMQYPEDTGSQGQARPVDRDAQQVRDRGFSPPRRTFTPRTRSCIFDLGIILARVGDHDGAIAEFQHARASTSPTQRSRHSIIWG